MAKRSNKKQHLVQTTDACALRSGVAPDSDCERYAPRPLNGEIDFELERQAIQQILDSVLRLQTYIAMRERRR